MSRQRALAFIIGAGMLLMSIGFAVGGALGRYTAEQGVAGLVALGFVTVVGGTVVWVLLEHPVKDPYKEPAPDYGDHDHTESAH